MNKLVIIGKVRNFQGLNGNLKIYSEMNVLKLKGIIVLKRGIRKDLFTIENVVKQDNINYLLKLKDVNNIDDAKNLIGSDIMILEKNLKDISIKSIVNSEEIIGMKIIDIELGYLGNVEDVMKTPASYIFSFTYNGKEILVPNVKTFVISINNEEKIITTNLKEVEQFES